MTPATVFDEAQHPREGSGRFAPKPQAAADPAVNAALAGQAVADPTNPLGLAAPQDGQTATCRRCDDPIIYRSGRDAGWDDHHGHRPLPAICVGCGDAAWAGADLCAACSADPSRRGLAPYPDGDGPIPFARRASDSRQRVWTSPPSCNHDQDDLLGCTVRLADPDWPGQVIEGTLSNVDYDSGGTVWTVDTSAGGVDVDLYYLDDTDIEVRLAAEDARRQAVEGRCAGYPHMARLADRARPA